MTPAEYLRRRRRLVKAIGPQSIVILPAASERLRNRDVHYPFRQDSDFSYLTGFPEPDAWCVLVQKRKEGEFILFCRPRDPEREQWDGMRIGPEGAIKRFGADQSHPMGALDEEMPKLIEGCKRLYYPIGTNTDLDNRVMGWVRQVRAKARSGTRAPEVLIDLGSILHEQRLKKSAAEIAILRRAARISAQAHLKLMRLCRPGLTEDRLAAEFRYRCALAGASELAYPSIVAGGAHACVLHYIENAAELRDGDLVLVDAGCELSGYASDITRTFPVNGRFTPAQRQIYEWVLKAQQAALKRAIPGRRWNEPHEAALKVLTKGLVELGILDGDPKQLIKDEAYKPYYMHRTGHWLGMDVHDVGDYQRDGEWRKLEPGMVFTVEPGLYLPQIEAVPEEYRGIGVRIEDTVLITEEGHEILSDAVPKDPEAIEQLMQRG
ncbi:Xaa-Pro aminopeptidase [Caldichromatium japonicum]|uniref:Xaa-Pro aminopeptidase n=1 Tax=Caldichromatium japonicum TaxID=2699430 RepID=A0A6G7V9Y6_9GAMM|nr:Xaa-Pro aminopeptidase [Caldichromatium japonicum]QIK36883.1 Xaa-Pro aminopeptidase [Caldichromatium japonicum]